MRLLCALMVLSWQRSRTCRVAIHETIWKPQFFFCLNVPRFGIARYRAHRYCIFEL